MIVARRAASPHAQSPHPLRLTLQADQGTTDASILIAISAHRTSARAIFSPQILEKSHGLAQRMRLARQLGDARPVARTHGVGGRQPRTAPAAHIGQRPVVGRSGQADATRGAKADLAKRTGPGLEQRDAARGLPLLKAWASPFGQVS